MSDSISPAQAIDIDQIAGVIRLANLPVAKLLGLTQTTAAKHPSFCTSQWIEADLAKGQKYFVYRQDDLIVGCVAFEQADSATAYLNRLAVLPEHQMAGIGTALVGHILRYAANRGLHKVGIGIIAEHHALASWYQKRGFVDIGTKTFPHLPFTVGFLEYSAPSHGSGSVDGG